MIHDLRHLHAFASRLELDLNILGGLEALITRERIRIMAAPRKYPDELRERARAVAKS